MCSVLVCVITIGFTASYIAHIQAIIIYVCIPCMMYIKALNKAIYKPNATA